jgi:hypothetical protein
MKAGPIAGDPSRDSSEPTELLGRIGRQPGPTNTVLINALSIPDKDEGGCEEFR